MENKELAKLIAKTGKQFVPGGPGPKEQEGPKGPGGPSPEKKVLMLLNAMTPDQPMPFISMLAGIPGPEAAKEILKPMEEQGLIAVSEEQDGERVKKKLTITDAGRAKVEADREALKAKMEAGKKAFKEKLDAKLNQLSEDEKETLAALLGKICGEE